MKRSRAGSSKAGSSTGGSWTLADLDRLSSASTLQVPAAVAGAPPDLYSLCRRLGRFCRDHSGPAKAADALRALATSGPMWPRVVLPLNQMVERSQQLSDLVEQGQVVSRWLYDAGVDLEVASQLHALEVEFQALLADMENRRSAPEVLLAQLREGDFLEAGSVRSTLSGLSTASKRARFGAGPR